MFETNFSFDILSENEKADAFDYIASHFYKKNFGDLSKTDVDLLMFHIYLEAKINNSKGIGNTISYIDFSDYKIGRELGITPQRVRNLKVKKELKYPQQGFDWRRSLKALLADPKKVVYEKGNIKINITRPESISRNTRLYRGCRGFFGYST